MVYGVIFAADGVDEFHLEYAYHRLREEGALVDVVSPDGGPITGARGFEWDDSTAIVSCLSPERYDIVVVPGGEAVATHAVVTDAVTEWLAEHVAANNVVAAIGHGVSVLSTAGLLDGRYATGPDTVTAGATGSDRDIEWTDEQVSVDGSVVTAKSAETLPYFMAAALDNVVLHQPENDALVERPSWT